MPHQHSAQYSHAQHNADAPDSQPQGLAAAGQAVGAVGHKVKPLQQGIVPRARTDGPADHYKADAPKGGQRGQKVFPGGGQCLVQRVHRHGQQRNEQRLQIPHVLPGRGIVQILPHGDGPCDDRHANAETEQQEKRQLGTAGIAAPAGAVQPAEGQQHGVHPERQHGKQRITDQCKGQEAPLLPGQPAGLVVGVAQPPEQRDLGQHKAGQKAAQQRRIAGKLSTPACLIVPPNPAAHQHPCDQVIERDLLIQIQQVAERPRRRTPAYPGPRRSQHCPQEKVHLPQ